MKMENKTKIPNYRRIFIKSLTSKLKQLVLVSRCHYEIAHSYVSHKWWGYVMARAQSY